MKKSLTLAAIMGCAALTACGGGATDETVNADNGMMMENIDTSSDMNMGTDMNMDMNVDTNTSTDMNASGNLDATGNGTDAGNASGNTL